MTSAFSWQNSVSLCPASFCSPRPNLPFIPGITLLPTFAFQPPVRNRLSISFWCLFYEDLQDLLELTHKKDILFIVGDWNAKVGSQETPEVTGKFGLGIQNEAGQICLLLQVFLDFLLLHSSPLQ